MATIKNYTSVEQSRKLAEILPLDSADGFWEYHDKWYSEGDEWEGYEDYPKAEPYLEYTRKENEWKEDKSDVPCWSLAALFKLMPNVGVCSPVLIKSLLENKYYCHYIGIGTYKEVYTTSFYDESIDACVEMILKLHELKLL